MDETEAWRPIPGWEGWYEASRFGQVRSVDRLITTRDLREHRIRGRVLRARATIHGYLQVNLSRCGKPEPRTVHDLVLSAFVGSRPEGMVTRHLDGNQLNNLLENLAWGTQSENMYDRVRHGTNPEAGKRACLRGHRLAAPNLKAAQATKGRRTCLACHRARTTAYRARERGVVLDLHAEADRQYQSIMSKAA